MSRNRLATAALGMALGLALLASGTAASNLARQADAAPALRPEGLAFNTAVVVSIGKAPGWAVGGRPGGVALQPAGCAGAACNGYTQSSAGDKTNEMYVFGQKPTSPFAAVGPRRGAPDAQGAGQPAPFLTVQLRNRGATLPADVAAPIVNLTVSFTPLSINGDAPPSTEAFSLTLGVMWTPGEGAKPNAAALFALVPPLPSAKFTAYGVAHQFQVTGIGLPELAAATGVEGKKLPWNKDAVATSGYGAALLPEEKCKWFLELWGELRVL